MRRFILLEALSLCLWVLATLAIANFFLVPGNLPFELIENKVYTGLDVGTGISPDQAFTTLGLDDDFHGEL